MLFILVQIQAGPPAFAGSASYGSASPSRGEGVPRRSPKSEARDWANTQAPEFP